MHAITLWCTVNLEMHHIQALASHFSKDSKNLYSWTN